MFKLVIADDEELIRSGLRDIVNWKSLGFEILETFADGRELMAYLDRHPVDVVLSDIKMTFVSGIEVARHVHSQGLPAKVILISGYREVGLAMQAIKYKVEDYILKPIDLDELTAVLRKTEAALRGERQAREAQRQSALLAGQLEEAKNRFFAELLSPGTRPAETFEPMFRLLYPRLSFADCACFICALRPDGGTAGEGDAATGWGADTGAAEVRKCLNRLAPEAFECRVVASGDGSVRVVGLSLAERPDERCRLAAEALEAEVRACASEALGLQGVFAGTHHCSGIPELLAAAGAGSGAVGRAPLPDGEAERGELDLVERVKRHIAEHITEDLSLEELAERFYLSPSYFSRIFKARARENLIDFIVRKKMERAAELLRQPQYKVYEVSHQVGYKSERYFSKVFKSYAGLSPNAYRARLFAGSRPEGDER